MVGPSCLNIISDVVQIATMGEIAVFFAVMDVGFELGKINRLTSFWRIVLFAFPSLVGLLFCVLGPLYSLFGKFIGLVVCSMAFM